MIDSSCTHESANSDDRLCPTCGRRLYRCAGLDYTDLVANRTRDFTGRAWVFQAIDAWLVDGRGPRLFFLSGDPGTGKSTVAARLVQMSEGEAPAGGCPRLGPGCLAFYQLCQASYNDTLDPLRFTTSLFLRLRDLLPAFTTALLQTLPQDPSAHVEQKIGAVNDHGTVIGIMHNIARLERLDVGSLPARVAFDRLIAAPLKKLGSALDGRLLILIDALDEALAQPGETLVDLLTSLVDDPRDLPPNVRLLVTARPDDRVLDAVGEPALDLVAGAPPDADDLRAYAHRRLDDLAEPHRTALADRIAAAAEGNFLYARYAIDDLPPLDRVIDLGALPLPSDLPDVYRQFLKRELARSRERWNAEYAPLLGVLAVAQDPGLTFGQLAGITGLDGSVLSNVLLAAGQYLAGPRPDGPFRLYHQSFRDFLLQDDRYRVFPADAHRQVAAFFWQAFHGGGDGDGLTYAVRYLPYHLTGAGDRPRLRELLLDYRWLSARLAEGDTAAAIADYGLAPDDPELRLVGGAIQLSAHILAADDMQLAGQLTGRLLDHPEPGIQALLAQAAASAPRPWLRPLTPSLAAPGGARLRTLEGHTSGVNSMAILPGGRRAVSASDDKTLILWDLETGKRLRTLVGHTLWVSSVAVLPDGRRAVSASWDGTLMVWDLESAERLRTLAGHTAGVLSVTILPDGRRAFSASWDNIVMVWDLDTGERLRTLEGHADTVWAVAVLPGGRQAVSASDGNTLIVWDLDTGKRLCTLAGHADAVHSAAILPDGRRAVSASWDNTLMVWNLETGERLCTLTGHTGGVNSVAVLSDGRQAFSASNDRSLIVWDLESGERLAAFRGDAAFLACAVTPDGRTVLAGDEGGRVHFLRLEGLE